jgi:multidrug efflux pump subunit AcrA (membrane-fusion protein)
MIPAGTKKGGVMKRILKWALFLIIVVAGGWYIATSLSKSSKPPVAAAPPALPKVPERVYGVVEPAGREVYVTTSVARPISRILVKEGDRVKKGQLILSLQNDVELAQLESALSKVDLRRKEYENSQYDLVKKKQLFDNQSATEYDFVQLRLKVELNAMSLEAARKDVDLVKAQLAQLELRSPVDGVVYKMDARLGETLSPGETPKIVLGSPDLWVRLYVETFWMDRFLFGARCQVFDSETNELIGTGTVLSKSPTLSTRTFRTDDVGERFDAEFQQIVLKLDPKKENVPIGLNVVASLEKK